MLLLPLSACGDVEELEPAADSRFQPGQVWHYHTRPGEEGSLVLVGKVDRGPEVGRIVHVKVVGVSVVRQSMAPANEISHIPMAESALAASVTTPATESVTLDGSFDETYDDWLDAYERGTMFVFKKPLAQTLTDIERSVSK